MYVAMTSTIALLALLAAAGTRADEVLFEDRFERGLSDKWKAVGLKEDDYRVRDGGLEMRVAAGKLTRETPRLQVTLPFTADDTVDVSVRVSPIDEFTREDEFAGVYLFDETGLEFGAKKLRYGGKLVFSPGTYEFIGKMGEEGDPDKYAVRYAPAAKEAGPLRIVVDRGHAFFQVGPSSGGQYLNFFHSAIRKKTRVRGFALVAAGAPDKSEHWVRFENFRVVKR